MTEQTRPTSPVAGHLTAVVVGPTTPVGQAAPHTPGPPAWLRHAKAQLAAQEAKFAAQHQGYLQLRIAEGFVPTSSRDTDRATKQSVAWRYHDIVREQLAEIKKDIQRIEGALQKKAWWKQWLLRITRTGVNVPLAQTAVDKRWAELNALIDDREKHIANLFGEVKVEEQALANSRPAGAQAGPSQAPIVGPRACA